MTKLHDTISRSTAASCPVCIISPYRFGITSSHSVSTPLPSDSIRDTHSRLDRSRIIALVPVPVLFLRVLVSLHFLDGRSRLRSDFHFETSLSILEHPHRLYPSHFPSPPNIFHPHPAPDRPRVPRSHSVITLFHQATIGPLCLINLAPPFAHEIPSLLRKGEVSSGLSPLEIDIGQVLNLRRDYLVAHIRRQSRWHSPRSVRDCLRTCRPFFAIWTRPLLNVVEELVVPA